MPKSLINFILRDDKDIINEIHYNKYASFYNILSKMRTGHEFTIIGSVNRYYSLMEFLRSNLIESESQVSETGYTIHMKEVSDLRDIISYCKSNVSISDNNFTLEVKSYILADYY